MNTCKVSAGVAAALIVISGGAQAITVDGSLDAAYGAATAHVTYLAAAPNSNFDAPTSFSDSVNYDIYLKASDGFVYGFLQSDKAGGAPGPVATFANLYFDLNPSVGDGSDLGFELSTTGQRAFVAGGSAAPMQVSGISVVSTDPSSLEFSIPFAYLSAPIAGLNYFPGQTFESDITLRLSQSFGYSVNGGATYGPDRLGALNIGSVVAVPEPESYALMLAGIGIVAMVTRRRNRAA